MTKLERKTKLSILSPRFAGKRQTTKCKSISGEKSRYQSFEKAFHTDLQLTQILEPSLWKLSSDKKATEMLALKRWIETAKGKRSNRTWSSNTATRLNWFFFLQSGKETICLHCAVFDCLAMKLGFSNVLSAAVSQPDSSPLPTSLNQWKCFLNDSHWLDLPRERNDTPLDTPRNLGYCTAWGVRGLPWGVRCNLRCICGENTPGATGGGCSGKRSPGSMRKTT